MAKNFALWLSTSLPQILDTPLACPLERAKVMTIYGTTKSVIHAIGAAALYTAGVPEKIIQGHTGHRSIECLRMYEHTNEKQQLAVSKVLS